MVYVIRERDRVATRFWLQQNNPQANPQLTKYGMNIHNIDPDSSKNLDICVPHRISRADHKFKAGDVFEHITSVGIVRYNRAGMDRSAVPSGVVITPKTRSRSHRAKHDSDIRIFRQYGGDYGYGIIYMEHGATGRSGGFEFEFGFGLDAGSEGARSISKAEQVA